MVYLTGFNTGNRVKQEILPLTATTVVVQAPYNWLVLTHTSTIAALTITLPGTIGSSALGSFVDTVPEDGQIVSISNIAAISALTFSPAVSGFTNTAALAAGHGITVAYSSALGVWFVAQN